MSRKIDNPIYETIDFSRLAKNPIYESKYDNLNRKLHQNPSNLMMSNIMGVMDSNTNTDTDTDNLPSDWIKLIEPVTGKPYYTCLTTKHTQWLHPNIPIGKMMPNGLPYGWEKEYDPTIKKYYYINHVGRFNTWNPPIKQRKYKGNNYIW